MGLKQYVSKVVFLIGILCLGACGGGSNNSSGDAVPIVNSGASALRILNGSDNNGEVVILLDGEDIGDLAPGDSVGYFELPPGVRTISVLDGEQGGATPLLLAETELDLAERGAYTFAVSGVRMGSAGFLYSDSTSRLRRDRFQLRVISTSISAGPVDVYLMDEEETSVEGREPFFRSLLFGGDTPYIEQDLGSLQVVLTDSGTTNVLTRAFLFTPDRGSIITLVIIDRVGEAGPFEVIELSRE